MIETFDAAFGKRGSHYRDTRRWCCRLVWMAITMLPATSFGAAIIECPEFVTTDARRGFIKTIRIPVRNSGDKPLQITTVKSSCGCLVGKDHPKLISPGETREILVEYTARGGSTTYQQALAIESNDPQKPIISVKLTGNLVDNDIFSASVTAIFLSRVVETQDDPVQDVLVRDEEGIQFLEFSIPSEHIEATTEKLGNSLMRIRIRGRASPDPVLINSVLSITRMRAKPEVLEIPIRYEIRPRISVYPRTIQVPSEDSENFFCRVTIKSNEGKVLQIEKVEVVGCSGLNVVIRKEADLQGSVAVKGIPTFTASGQRGLRIFLRNDMPDNPSVFVPIE